MSENTTQWVAAQLPKHPGSTCQDLFRLYIDKFATLGMERGIACAALKKEFQRLEDTGLVIGVKGKQKTDPTKWTWTGPDPTAAAVVEMSPLASGLNIHHGEVKPQAGPDYPIWSCTLPTPDRTNPALILDDDDPLDCVLIEVRRQFRSRARGIENAEYKRDVLARISGMMAPDIADVLNEIIEDLA